jgi:hypothetical protein
MEQTLRAAEEVVLCAKKMATLRGDRVVS